MLEIKQWMVSSSLTNPWWSWAFNLSMRILTFSGVKRWIKVGASHVGLVWGMSNLPYSCQAWCEVSCALGCLSLNILHVNLLSCSRNGYISSQRFGSLILLVYMYKSLTLILLTVILLYPQGWCVSRHFSHRWAWHTDFLAFGIYSSKFACVHESGMLSFHSYME